MAVTFTKDQQDTIEARDSSVLVSAAAGSGKTAVLVERIIRMVSDTTRPVDIDRLLVVTFTSAAAAQMRERITQALSTAVEEQPGNSHLVRQLTLIHNAQITTIDSFCLYLIRNHFDEIDLDPDFRVGDEGEIRLLRHDVLHTMLEEYFDAKPEGFLDCVEYFAPGGDEKRLEEQILSLYEFAMSYPWPEEWLAVHRQDYDLSGEALESCDWAEELKGYVNAILREAGRILEQTRSLCEEPDGPYMYLDALESDEAQLKQLMQARSLEELYTAFSGLSFARISSRKDESVSAAKRERAKQWRNGEKELLTVLAKKYFYASPQEQRRRMEHCAPHVRALLGLTEDFIRRFNEKKREKNLLDFHDMEHMALSILTRREEGRVIPTPTAVEMRESYAEIMIDEYQDSNLVQEFLLKSISGEETGHYNRFMVGDVKQSIYKFRLARPELFMEKFEAYRGAREGEPAPRERRIDLKKNFRSRRQVTDSVNQVFSCIMGRDLGGVAYDEDAALYPGAVYPEPEGGEELYQTELLLTEGGEDGLEDKEREALAVAGRIRELVGSLPVTDGVTKELRPARYGDMVILLRTTAGWDETFKKVLEECGIPVYITSRTGYFAAPEVQTILNFLKVLNNPRQDIPLFGVLKSGAASFTDQEIACIRAAASQGKLYRSLEKYAGEGEDAALRRKCAAFLGWLSEFREMAAYMPIHELIQAFLDRTGYLYTISALPGGEQRRANVQMLLVRAENFEKTSYFGLFHFIRYMEQVEKYDIDYGEASLQDENADTVRIMSIHKSKGLEFPVCFVSGLAKRFNMQDTAKPVIMDMDLGIGVDCVDAVSRVKRSTLKKNVMAGRLQRDSLGEELRVLYVAMTRAQEKLILTGNIKEERAQRLREELEEGGLLPAGGVSPADAAPEASSTGEPFLGGGLLPFSLRTQASCYLDWLLPAWTGWGKRVELLPASGLLARQVKEEQGQESLLLRLRRLAAKKEEQEQGLEERSRGQETRPSLAEDWGGRRLRERMESVYAHTDLEKLYTKTTVSELKKAGMEEDAGEAYRLFEEAVPVPYVPAFIRKEEQQAAGTARGSAYHKALELYPFEKTETGAEEELDRMAESGRLSPEYRKAVSPYRLGRFLQSGLARRMGQAAREGRLHREQPFVLGLSARELSEEFPEEETVLIQGIIDVYFEEEDGVVVADYKTDAVTRPEELADRYRVQLDYYARALEQLTGKRVKEKLIYSFALQQEIWL